MRQTSMIGASGGGTLRGISKPGLDCLEPDLRLGWPAELDAGLAEVVKLSAEETPEH